ncbi:hypothetical protein [Streptomyces uncialis]|uniref:hypothetical protein n=1 Tax=Streptomyces uncialis TaxID=1048205 RepID=UPI00386DBE1F|nr:hypothetical protein OG924_12490 [Streptomyces uncialis]
MTDVGAEVRRLAAEGVSRRRTAARLRISRYAVGRYLDDAAADVAGALDDAVGEAADEPAVPADRPTTPTDVAGPVGQGRVILADHPAASLDRSATLPAAPAKMAGPPPGSGPPLALHPDRWPGVAAALGAVRPSGWGPHAIVYHAVHGVAHAYRGALRAGALRPADPLVISHMHLAPTVAGHDRPDPATPPGTTATHHGLVLLDTGNAPGLRQALDALGQAGWTWERAAAVAVIEYGRAYRAGLATGHLRPGDRPVVGPVWLLRPHRPPHPPATPATPAIPAAAPAGVAG